MKDRIKAIMNSLKMTQGDFSKFIGISPSILSSIYKGRTNATLGTVLAIREKIPNISYDWLIDGVGDMYVKGGENSDFESVPTQQDGLEALKEEGSASYETKSALKNKRGLAIHMDNDMETKNPDRPNYRVTEIRVYFDDYHFESFVPSK